MNNIAIKNLTLLKNHLESKNWIVCNLDMGNFGGINFEFENLDDLSKIKNELNIVHDCGTSACLLGYAPEVIPITKEDFKIYKINSSKKDNYSFFYLDYSERVFPDLNKRYVEDYKEIEDYNNSFSLNPNNDLWSFIFSSSNSNNVKLGIKRIELVINALSQEDKEN